MANAGIARLGFVVLEGCGVMITEKPWIGTVNGKQSGSKIVTDGWVSEVPKTIAFYSGQQRMVEKVETQGRQRTLWLDRPVTVEDNEGIYG